MHKRHNSTITITITTTDGDDDAAAAAAITALFQMLTKRWTELCDNL